MLANGAASFVDDTLTKAAEHWEQHSLRVPQLVAFSVLLPHDWKQANNDEILCLSIGLALRLDAAEVALQ